MRYATTLVTAALVVILSGAAAHAAEAPASRRVTFGDLDLSKKEDTLILDRRLRTAARRVCFENAIRTTADGVWQARCVRTAVTKAYADLAARRPRPAPGPVEERLAERSHALSCTGDCPPSPFDLP